MTVDVFRNRCVSEHYPAKSYSARCDRARLPKIRIVVVRYREVSPPHCADAHCGKTKSKFSHFYFPSAEDTGGDPVGAIQTL